VQLSILFPTHRHDLTALSRVAQACSWAGPKVEVLVRDNSGNAEKAAQIARFRRDHCTILSVAPCEPLENYSALMQLAKGDFVFCVADDDLYFDRAMAELPALIDRIGRDRSVAAITGPYLVENSKGANLVSYPSVDSDDVTARVAGYAGYPGVNSLFYSVQRRDMVERIMRFMGAMPFYLSYHDQILCLLYLLTGKFVKLSRIFYGYDVGPWENLEPAQKRDVGFYTAAGLDPAINKLHWFLCAFEGAILIRNGNVFPDHPLAERQKMADIWFSNMFQRFLVNPRLVFDSRCGAEADALCRKLRESQGSLSFLAMLSDICQFIALTSGANAQRYLTFWAELLKPRQAAASA
jgi:hypothetical protein